MPGAEVLRRAADLVMTVGLHRGAFWAGADEHLAYVEGEPVCALGAVAVIRGARTEAAAITATDAADPAHRALIALVGGVETSCVAYKSDRWARRGMLGRRVVAMAMRRAARACHG